MTISTEKKILIVDDDIDLCTLIGNRFRDRYTVIMVHTVKDAYAALKQDEPFIIFLDYNLPDGFGTDLLNTVNLNKAIPVVMMTGDDSREVANKAAAEKVTALLLKPLDLVKLETIIEGILLC